MTIAMLTEIPGLTREVFDAVAQQANQAGSPPGLLYHVAGPMESGYRIIDVWESQDAATAFFSSADYQQAIASLVMQPRITTWPIYALDDGSGWRKIA